MSNEQREVVDDVAADAADESIDETTGQTADKASHDSSGEPRGRNVKSEGDGEPAPAVGEFSPDELKALAHQLEQSRDQIKRQAAEFQNYRRRTEQEKAQMVEFGKKLVIEQLLDVIDDFRRSLDAATEAADDRETGPAFDSLKSGVEMVYSKLMDELERLGVETIDAVGEPFDEELHEALMQQPAPEGTAPGTVLAEIQKGYRLGDRVIRHARVVVAT